MATKARAGAAAAATTLDLGGAVAAAGGGAKGLYRDAEAKVCVRFARMPRNPRPGCAARRVLPFVRDEAPLAHRRLSFFSRRRPRSCRPKSNNIMYDKRVVRGSTYAMPVIPHVSSAAAPRPPPRARPAVSAHNLSKGSRG
jgi:hypothetical protein